MYFWWSLCTLHLFACQVSYRRRHMTLLCLYNDFRALTNSLVRQWTNRSKLCSALLHNLLQRSSRDRTLDSSSFSLSTAGLNVLKRSTAAACDSNDFATLRAWLASGELMSDRISFPLGSVGLGHHALNRNVTVPLGTAVACSRVLSAIFRWLNG